MSKDLDFFQDAFAEQDERKKKAEEAEGNNFANISYQQVKSLGLNPNIMRTFRIVGYPDRKGRSPEDAKLVLRSKIVKDDGKKYFYVNWPYIEKDNGKFVPDPNWILTRAMDTVKKGEWVNYEESDVNGESIVKKVDGTIINASNKRTGRYVVDNPSAKSYLEYESNTIGTDKFPPRFYPDSRALLNVVDREDEWCKENKHTKVLATKVGSKVYPAKKEGEPDKTVFFPDTGISYSMYMDICTHFRSYRGDWNVDLAIKRFKSNKWTASIQDALDIKKLPDEIKAIITEDPLTTEEENYERYDFDFLYKDCGAMKLKRNKFKWFQQIDIDFGTNLANELTLLAEAEKKEMDEKNKKEKETAKEEVKEEVKTEVAKEEVKEPEVTEKEEVKEPETKKREPRGTKKDEVSDTESFSLPNYFVNWDKLTKEDKVDIEEAFKEFDKETGIRYLDTIDVAVCDDPECYFPGTEVKTLLPSTVIFCPVCGMEFTS